MDSEQNDHPIENNHKAGQSEGASEETPVAILERGIDSLRVKSRESDALPYRDFWNEARGVLEQFKTVKPLAAEERRRLWEQYREICDIVHLRQVEERHSLREESQTKRIALETQLAEARSLLVEDASLEALSRARDLVASVMNHMKSHTEAMPGEHSAEGVSGRIPVRLLKEDREAIWYQWQEVRESLTGLQSAFHRQFITQAQALASEAATNEPAGVLKQIRLLQQEVIGVGIGREQREEIRGILNEAWKTAIERLQLLREERRAKHAEWKARMQENLTRWKDQISRREQTKAHLREQIEKLQGMVENARNDEHAERVRGWLAETEVKLQNTEQILASLQEKIRAVQAKLRH